MTRVSILVVLALSAFAGTEVPLAPLDFGPVPTFSRPAIATDGIESLVVWNDDRDRVANAIYAARLDADGTLLDPVGIRLMAGLGAPSIAFGDDRYFVVEPGLRFAILDRDAKVLTRGVVAESVSGSVKVIFNGRDFIVLWGYESVNASTVDRDGHVSEPVRLVPQTPEVRLQAAAINGSRIVALYTRGGELRALATTATGAPISDEPIAQQVFAEVPASIASSANGFVAAWQPLAGVAVAVAAIDSNGAVVQGPLTAVTGAFSPNLAGTQLFTLEGSLPFYRLTRWTIADDLTVSLPKTVIQSQFLGVQYHAAAGDQVVATLHDPNRPVAEEGLYAVDATAPAEPRLVSRAAARQFEPRLATAENGTLVAWRQRDSLWATFLPRVGEPVHFFVAGGVIGGHSVAAQGRTHLVTWSTGRRNMMRLYREHIPLTGVLLLDSDVEPAVAASDGNGFVVAWVYGSQIRIVRVSTGGMVTNNVSFSYGNVTGFTPLALSCGDGMCAIFWRNQTSTQTCPRILCRVVDERVMVKRLDSSLRWIDAVPMVMSENLSGIPYIASTAYQNRFVLAWVSLSQTYVKTTEIGAVVVPGTHPALARAGDAWIVVREHDGALVAMRIRDQGAPYEFTLMRDGQTRTAPAVSHDGDASIVAYERTTIGEPAGGVPRIYVTSIPLPEPKRRAISR